MAFITINGKEFPSPDTGLELLIATYVTDGKNAKGEFIGDKVGRDQYKINALQWRFLDAATWSDMLKEFSSFVVTARIFDMVNNDWITLQMYPGNRTAKPVDEAGPDGKPSMLMDCKVNIIDCGVID